MNPMPTPQDLSVLYPDNYYSYQVPKLDGNLKQIARSILRYPRIYSLPRFDKPGTMVDVGCGAGQYLLEMQAKGWRVYGAELSKAAAEAGRKAGLDIRGGELSEARFPDKHFDFVRSNHSFEHIPNPDAVLAEMHRIMKDDGRMFLGIPNLSSAWGRLFGKYWWNFGLPVHTMNYTVRGITEILERNGFKVDRIVHNSDWSGLAGSLQIAINARSGRFSSDGVLVRGHAMRLPFHYVSKLMDLVGRGDCIEVHARKA